MEKKILLIDDDAITRMAAVGVFENEPGWQITEAADGQEALDLLLGGYRPDVCLLDVRMPNLDGLGFARAVRADPQLCHLRIVVMSGSDDRDTIVAFARLRVSGFLQKPYSMDKALGVLRPLLATPAA